MSFSTGCTNFAQMFQKLHNLKVQKVKKYKSMFGIERMSNGVDPLEDRVKLLELESLCDIS